MNQINQSHKNNYKPKPKYKEKPQEKTQNNFSTTQEEQIIKLTNHLQKLHLDLQRNTKDNFYQKQQKLAKKNNKILTNKQAQKKLQNDEDINILSDKYNQFLLTQCTLHKQKNKETKQLKDGIYHPLISQEQFEKIYKIWKKDQQSTQKQKYLKKTHKITYVLEINNNFLTRLKPKHWLNDEVINSYIQLLKLDVLDKNLIKSSEITVFQSFFAALNLNNDNIIKAIYKQKLTLQTLVVIPINEDNHWFFLVIFKKRLLILDSILPKIAGSKQELIKKQYCMKESVVKCLKLFQTLNKIEQIQLNHIKLMTYFPQQDNQYDCGMMMLCGIKNIIKKFILLKNAKQELRQFYNSIRKQDFWDFCIEDMRHARYLFAKEIMKQSISM